MNRRFAAVALVVLAGCSGAGSKTPEALATYLDALVAGEYRAAYDRTGLGALAETSAEASTLSFAHVSAFFAADPLLGYEVRKVTTLDRRSIGAAQETGTPYYVADVTLRHRSGRIEQTLSVAGAVLGVVEVDPVPVRIRGSAAQLSIDGVRAQGPVSDARTILILPGAHRVTLGDDAVEFNTSPLRILSGPGRIDDGVLVLG